MSLTSRVAIRNRAKQCSRAARKGLHLFPFFVGIVRTCSLIIAIAIKCFYREHRGVSRSGCIVGEVPEEVNQGRQRRSRTIVIPR